MTEEQALLLLQAAQVQIDLLCVLVGVLFFALALGGLAFGLRKRF